MRLNSNLDKTHILLECEYLFRMKGLLMKELKKCCVRSHRGFGSETNTIPHDSLIDIIFCPRDGGTLVKFDKERASS